MTDAAYFGFGFTRVGAQLTVGVGQALTLGGSVGRLVTSGLYGWTMVVTGTGSTIAEAKHVAYARVAKITVPNLRYRLDIGDRLIAGDLDRVRQLGLIDEDLPAR